MMNFLRTLEFLGLSFVAGERRVFEFVVAPGAFRILASRDQAGAVVGFGLWWMHMIGVVCGIVILLARLARTRTFASSGDSGGDVRRADDFAHGCVAARR